MPKKSYRTAINEALRMEMERDPRVILIGEDIAGGQGGSAGPGKVGGVLGVTAGLYDRFGPSRVIDTPITESAIIGAAAGAATTGMRPVAEIMFVDFVGVCFDQIYNQAAKFRYMFGGKARTPLVIRAMIGAGFRAGAQHSQTLTPLFTMVPGLKVVAPSNAYDAKGLLIEAIRDDDPVIFLESKTLYDTEDDVPDEAYRIPFGEARVAREGDDITIVAIAAMAPRALAVAKELEKAGIDAEVIDPRTTSPLDEETLIESIERTGRVVIVEESPPRCSVAADIAAMLSDKAFKHLKAPIRRVTCPHTPVPFAPNLEDEYIPNSKRIREAVDAVLAYG
ncbi:MAG: alpha-ketoacid dehydrogenase subunit beta [Rhodobacter sp.]|jgi:pyruvate/2-oxoglutarate/acetoin dehydrogenase E1 component|uniref:alpha-ketoacid dehydrogenase subunit beta n=1 Tax=Phenylobacterium sp. TaxID=1871053 RepID=UPI0025DEF30C|nr:alpha-ketoacid dehydrogenase subunit beta [Phenylobacterium sp.]MCA3504466.1 alpha-ketoacid dehydrogenase subunit beta [Rhodobacter sp.]MCA3641996.1 alpha-ketoacid dehydrogenase subunit beta [Methylobacterium sp.]MCA3740868.1 alpha-ketoacid dehydrogenase subunit beta [Phenylobacterium sp.]MCA6263036.1 alpha-ketoacid dehydrogenase subunit beta [Phenylobacterium sp.]MCA6276123.1 alpha-ketoacid dehydrogenase subunit beta [Phenylobacterium sp.]